MIESTRGYVQVRGGEATLHMPHGGKWVGGTEKVRVKLGTPDGVYRCRAEHIGAGCWFVFLGTKVEPQAEAKRLAKLAEVHDKVGTRMPGVEGYAEQEKRAQAGHNVKRQIQRHFAELLARFDEEPAQ